MREAPCDGSSHSFLTQPTVDMNTGVIRCGQHRLHWKFRFLGLLESCNEIPLEPFPAERIKNALNRLLCREGIDKRSKNSKAQQVGAQVKTRPSAFRSPHVLG